MKLQQLTFIGLSIFILLSSVIMGHFFAPVIILASPLIVAVAAWFIVFTDNGFNIIIKAVLVYLFLGLNDIGIRIFSGGIHDTEGLGWINLVLVAAAILAAIILSIGVLRDAKGATDLIKVAAVLTFISLAYIHLQVFQSLGD